MPKSEFQLTEEIIVTLLRTINKIQVGRREPRDFGMGISMTLLESEMCALISRQAGVTAAELSEQLGVTRSATSQVVSKLREKGFVEDRRDSVDLKRKMLYLTDLGEEAAGFAARYLDIMREALFGTSRAELAAYKRFVSKLEAFHDEINARSKELE